MTKNTIDDRLKGEFVVQFGHLFLSKEETVELRTEAFKQALYQDLLALVGEDETSEDEVENDLYFATRNGLRQELRQNINQYFKRGESDG